MTDKCSICLEELHDNIGVAVPCGHCLHRKCFDLLKNATRERDCEDKPECPICKQEIKKFHPVFLTFQQSFSDTDEDGSKSREGVDRKTCRSDEEALKALQTQNIHLRSALRQLKVLSNDQSDLLLNLLPQYQESKSRILTLKRDKKDLERLQKETEEENSHLISRWSEAEKQLFICQTEKEEMEERIAGEREEERVKWSVVWSALGEKLTKSQKKRSQLKKELKRVREEWSQREVELNGIKEERDELKGNLEREKALERKLSQNMIKMRKNTTRVRRVHSRMAKKAKIDKKSGKRKYVVC